MRGAIEDSKATLPNDTSDEMCAVAVVEMSLVGILAKYDPMNVVGKGTWRIVTADI